MRCNFDPEYVEQRDKLIPLADAYAEALAAPCPMGIDFSYWDGGYSKLFAQKMQQLAMERGLTCGMPHERKALL